MSGHDAKEELIRVGYDASNRERAGSFIQSDGRVDFTGSFQEGVEILAIEEALKKYPEVSERYYGKAFAKLGREFDPATEGGYFIRVRAGVKTAFPVQACLWLKSKNFRQKVHNVIVVEEGAEAYLLTGCTSAKAAHEGYHLGLSEFFVHKNAFLNFTMIHSWKKDVDVEPRSVAIVEEGGSFLSNYICLQPVRTITMYPTCLLEGAGGRARFNSIILSYPGSLQDIGSRVILAAKGTSAEIIARTVSKGGTIISRGHLKGMSPGIKAHLECRGLMLTEEGRIHAIPELETLYEDVEMSHEAAIGRIRKDDIEYLASRGIPEDEAQSLIIRGFMDVKILGLPPLLEQEIARAASASLSDTF